MAVAGTTYSEADLAIGREALLRGWSSKGETGLLLVSAQGATVTDVDGREYIDCTSQAWSTNVGANDPRVIEAAIDQIRHITHVKSNFESFPMLRLARKLLDIAPEGLAKVGFCLHGSLAVEMAMKLAMKNRPGAGPFITLFDGYHGRSLATMAASWPHIDDAFRPYWTNVVRVPAPNAYRNPLGIDGEAGTEACLAALRSAIRMGINGRPAAVLMEPFQGNGGQVEFPLAYLQGVRRICDEEGVILIWDEVQTGFGRMGTMWASDYYGVTPDILVFGKAIGGGFPLAGILSRTDLGSFDPGDDALTFGLWPVSMAAALAAIAVIEEDDLLGNCRRVGEYARSRLLEMQERHRLIGDIRGPGLMIGVELVRDRLTKERATRETHEVCRLALGKGVILGDNKYAGLGNVLKIKPPLVITEAQMDRVLDVIDESLTEVEASE